LVCMCSYHTDGVSVHKIGTTYPKKLAVPAETSAALCQALGS
jgi:hypothetical protein